MEAVPICRFDKGAQRCGVGGTFDQFRDLLVLEAVYDAEKSVACPMAQGTWSDRRLSCALPRIPGGCGRLAIPAKQPANEETDVQERADDRRGHEQTRACRPQKLIPGDAGARTRQIDGPHVMKRHAWQESREPAAAAVRTLVSRSGASGLLHANECNR
jgi:hypothetical protein